MEDESDIDDRDLLPWLASGLALALHIPALFLARLGMPGVTGGSGSGGRADEVFPLFDLAFLLPEMLLFGGSIVGGVFLIFVYTIATAVILGQRRSQLFPPSRWTRPSPFIGGLMCLPVASLGVVMGFGVGFWALRLFDASFVVFMGAIMAVPAALLTAYVKWISRPTRVEDHRW